MKDNVGASLRIKLLLYALFSAFLTLLTDLLIIAGVLFYKRDMLLQLNTNIGRNNFERMPVFLSTHIILDIFLLLLCSIFLYLLYFLILTNNMIRYMREIVLGVERMRDGDLETKIEVKDRTELSEIAGALNDMQIQLNVNQEVRRQAEKTKDELITNVAHDLRTPLTSIIGYLDLVRRDALLTSEQKKKYIGIAYDKSKSLERMIESLFDYTRYDKEKIKIRLAKVNFCQFIMQLAEEFYPSFTEKKVVCKLEIDEQPIFVKIDGELMARAVGNLISNAIKYGADGKLVQITVRREEASARLLVTNYGKVIPKEDIEKIFDKFYRVEHSRSMKTGGTGLGLAIAKNIIKLHEGEISAKSDITGTVFEVSLPIAE